MEKFIRFAALTGIALVFTGCPEEPSELEQHHQRACVGYRQSSGMVRLIGEEMRDFSTRSDGLDQAMELCQALEQRVYEQISSYSGEANSIFNRDDYLNPDTMTNRALWRSPYGRYADRSAFQFDRGEAIPTKVLMEVRSEAFAFTTSIAIDSEGESSQLTNPGPHATNPGPQDSDDLRMLTFIRMSREITEKMDEMHNWVRQACSFNPIESMEDLPDEHRDRRFAAQRAYELATEIRANYLHILAEQRCIDTRGAALAPPVQFEQPGQDELHLPPSVPGQDYRRPGRSTPVRGRAAEPQV